MVAMRVGSEGMKAEELVYVNNNNIINNNSNSNSNNKMVMTEKQLEELRRQISAYATICEQLVQMHKSITTAQHLYPGMRVGNVYCDPMMMTSSSGHKISARQRWTPTPTQLQILESIFDQGNGTPGKQKVKELTNELSQHGPISETNVYNWFQNRRARSKRKQSSSEAEGEVESSKEKKSQPSAEDIRVEKAVDVELVGEEGRCFGDKVDSVFEVDRGLRFSQGFDHAALFDPRMDYLLDKVEGFSHYQLDEVVFNSHR